MNIQPIQGAHLGTNEPEYTKIVKYIFILGIIFLITLAQRLVFSQQLLKATEGIIKILSIVTTLFTFIILWNPYDRIINKSIFLCIGFFSVAIFECINTFLLFTLNYGSLYNNYIFNWFNYIIRITMVLTLFVYVVLNKRVFLKGLVLGISVVINVLIISFILLLGYSYELDFYFSDRLMNYIHPTIYIGSIIISGVCVYLLLRANVNGRKGKSVFSKYVFYAIMFSLPADLICALHLKRDSVLNQYSGVLILVSYFFISKAAYLSMLSIPYREVVDSQRKLKNILDDMPIGLAIYDSELYLDFMNKAGAELLNVGCPIETSSFSLIGKDNPFSKDFDKVINGSVSYLENYVNYTDSMGKGSILTIKLIKFNNDVLVVFNDFKSQGNKAFMPFHPRTILDAITDMLFIIDNEYRIVLYNEPVKNKFNRYEICFDNMDFRQFAKEVGWNIEGIQKGLFTEKQSNIETSIKNKALGIVSLFVHSSPIYNNDEEIVGSIIMATDITEYKRGQESYIQREKLALLGRMGAEIVHETKNFLMTIKGSSQILKLIATDDETLKYARKIDQATNEVNRIITEFLNIAKPKEPDFENISLEQLMIDSNNIIESIANINGVDLNMVLQDKESIICCDGGQLRQVILNIVKNGIEAMKKTEHPKIEITTGVYDEDKIFINICDNGPGIPKHIIDKIGTPFFTTKEKGTGLGLSLCFKIIKEHKGVLKVDSKLNEGTTFSIILPRVKNKL